MVGAGRRKLFLLPGYCRIGIGVGVGWSCLAMHTTPSIGKITPTVPNKNQRLISLLSHFSKDQFTLLTDTHPNTGRHGYQHWAAWLPTPQHWAAWLPTPQHWVAWLPTLGGMTTNTPTLGGMATNTGRHGYQHPNTGRHDYQHSNWRSFHTRHAHEFIRQTVTSMQHELDAHTTRYLHMMEMRNRMSHQRYSVIHWLESVQPECSPPSNKLVISYLNDRTAVRWCRN